MVAENVRFLFYQSWIAGGYANLQSHIQLENALLGGDFQLEVEIKNKGVGGDAPNVIVHIESSNPNVTISATDTLGNIAARIKVNNASDPFDIHVGTFSSGDNFELDIVVYQDGVEIDRKNPKHRAGE